MHRVVLDTNVIVSALVFGGVPRQIVELIEAGLCSFFYSRDIQLEVRRVLLEKFIWSEERLDDDLAIVWSLGVKVVPQHRLRVVAGDPDDDRIVECALAGNADAIVSGDSPPASSGILSDDSDFVAARFPHSIL